MQLLINGEEKDLPGVQTLQDVVETLKLDTRFVAMALNMECIPKSQYGQIKLKDKDALEIVSPQSGG